MTAPRRLLGDTLVEVAAGMADADRLTPGLAIHSLEVTLPIELTWRGTGADVQMLGELPRTVTRTAFDRDPSRVAVVWRLEPGS